MRGAYSLEIASAGVRFASPVGADVSHCALETREAREADHARPQALSSATAALELPGSR